MTVPVPQPSWMALPETPRNFHDPTVRVLDAEGRLVRVYAPAEFLKRKTAPVTGAPMRRRDFVPGMPKRLPTSRVLSRKARSAARALGLHVGRPRGDNYWSLRERKGGKLIVRAADLAVIAKKLDEMKASSTK